MPKNEPKGWPWQIRDILSQPPNPKEFDGFFKQSYLDVIPNGEAFKLNKALGFLGWLSVDLSRRTGYTITKRMNNVFESLGLEPPVNPNDEMVRSFRQDFLSPAARQFYWSNFFLFHEPWKFLWSVGKAMDSFSQEDAVDFYGGKKVFFPGADYVKTTVNPKRTLDVLSKAIDIYSSPEAEIEMNKSWTTGLLNVAGDLTLSLDNFAYPIIAKKFAAQAMRTELKALEPAARMIKESTTAREIRRVFVGLYGRWGGAVDIVNYFEGIKKRDIDKIAQELYAQGFRTGQSIFDEYLPRTMKAAWQTIPEYYKKLIADEDISLFNAALADNFDNFLAKGLVTAWDQKALRYMPRSKELGQVFQRIDSTKKWVLLDQLLRTEDIHDVSEVVKILGNAASDSEIAPIIPDLIKAHEEVRKITRASYFRSYLNWISEKAQLERIAEISDLNLKKDSILETITGKNTFAVVRKAKQALVDINEKIKILSQQVPSYRQGYSLLKEVAIKLSPKEAEEAPRKILRSYIMQRKQNLPLAATPEKVANGLAAIYFRERPALGNYQRYVMGAKEFIAEWDSKLALMPEGEEKLKTTRLLQGARAMLQDFNKAEALPFSQRSKVIEGLIKAVGITSYAYKSLNLLTFPGFLLMQATEYPQKLLALAFQQGDLGLLYRPKRSFDHLGEVLDFTKIKWKELTFDAERLGFVQKFTNSYFSFIDNWSKNQIGRAIYTAVTEGLEKTTSDPKVITALGRQAAEQAAAETIFFTDSAKIAGGYLGNLFMYPVFGVSNAAFWTKWVTQNWYFGVPKTYQLYRSLQDNGLIDQSGNVHFKMDELSLKTPLSSTVSFTRLLNIFSDPNYEPQNPDEALKLKVGRIATSVFSGWNPWIRPIAEFVGLSSKPFNRDIIGIESSIRKVSASYGNQFDFTDWATDTIRKVLGMSTIDRELEETRQVRMRQEFAKKSGISEGISETINYVKSFLKVQGFFGAMGFPVYSDDEISKNREEVRLLAKEIKNSAVKRNYIDQNQNNQNVIPISNDDSINRHADDIIQKASDSSKKFYAQSLPVQQSILEILPSDISPPPPPPNVSMPQRKTVNLFEAAKGFEDNLKSMSNQFPAIFPTVEDARKILLNNPIPIPNTFNPEAASISYVQFLDRSKAEKIFSNSDIIKMESEISKDYNNFKSAISQLDDQKILNKIVNEPSFKPFILAIENVANYGIEFPAMKIADKDIQISEDTRSYHQRLQRILTGSELTIPMQRKESAIEKSITDMKIKRDRADSILLNASPSDIKSSAIALRSIYPQDDAIFSYIKNLEIRRPDIIKNFAFSILEAKDFLNIAQLGRYPKAANFLSIIEPNMTPEELGAFQNSFSRIAILYSSDPATFGNFISEGSQAGFAFRPENGLSEIFSNVENLLGIPQNSLKVPDYRNFNEAANRIIQNMEIKYPNPPRFRTFVEAASWVANAYESIHSPWKNLSNFYEDQKTSIEHWRFMNGMDKFGKPVPFPNTISYLQPEPTIWKVWQKVIETDPTITARFPLQLLEVYSQFAHLAVKDRQMITAASNAVGATELVTYLFKATGLLSPAMIANPLFAIPWIGVALTAGILGYNQQRKERKNRDKAIEQRQREIDARNAEIELERKKLEADRIDRNAWEEVLKSRRTFFDAVSRAPQTLQRFAELRSEEIFNFIRRPQYASSVGLARNLEREMGRLLRPRF